MVVSTLLHNAVYSNFFLSFWTNDVEDFMKVTWIIFPPSCQLRFSIVVLETFYPRKTKWQCNQYLTLNPTCDYSLTQA